MKRLHPEFYPPNRPKTLSECVDDLKAALLEFVKELWRALGGTVRR